MMNEEKISTLRHEVANLRKELLKSNEINRQLRKEINMVKHSFTRKNENIRRDQGEAYSRISTERLREAKEETKALVEEHKREIYAKEQIIEILMQKRNSFGDTLFFKAINPNELLVFD